MNNLVFSRALRPAALGVGALSLALALAGCNGNSGSGADTGSGASSSGDTIANVGATSITRAELGRFLEANFGAQALPYLIDTALVQEEGKAKGITVSDDEISADLARRQTNDPSIEAQTKENPLLLGVIRQQTRRELTVQRLLTADIKMDDAKLRKFFDTYKSYYDQPGKVKLGLLMSSTKARADALARSLAAGKSFDSVVEEQQKAQDSIAQNSSKDRGNFEPINNFEPKLRVVLEKTPVGTTTPVQTVAIGPGQTIYAIFRIIERQPFKKADLTALKPILETDAKMMEVAVVEIKKNPQNPTSVQENLKRVAAQLSQVNPASKPTMRDILSFILRPAAERRLSEMRLAGKVSISDPNYTKIGAKYAPPVTTSSPGATTSAPGAGTSAAPSATAPR